MDVVPCTQVEAHGRFGIIYCLHLLGRRVSQVLFASCLLICSSILTMAVMSSSETLVRFYPSARHIVQEDKTLHFGFLIYGIS